MIDDSYSLGGAKHYDAAYSVKDDLVDRDFYLDLADEYGGPILEFGCGTGRITLPLARQGVDVTGMDASHSMLEVLRAKLAKERESVQPRTRVVVRMVKMTRSSRALVEFHVATLLYGFISPFGKAVNLNPHQIAFWRTTLAAVVLLAIARRLKSHTLVKNWSTRSLMFPKI